MGEASTPESVVPKVASEKASKKHVKKKAVRGIYYHAAEHHKTMQAYERKWFFHKMVRGFVEPFAIHVRALRLHNAIRKYEKEHGESPVLTNDFVKEALSGWFLAKSGKISEQTKQRVQGTAAAHKELRKAFGLETKKGRKNEVLTHEEQLRAHTLIQTIIAGGGKNFTDEEVGRYAKEAGISEEDFRKVAHQVGGALESASADNIKFKTDDDMRRAFTDEVIYAGLSPEQQKLAAKVARASWAMTGAAIPRYVGVALAASTGVGVVGIGALGLLFGGTAIAGRLRQQGALYNFDKKRNIAVNRGGLALGFIDKKLANSKHFRAFARMLSVNWESEDRKKQFARAVLAGVGVGLVLKFVEPGLLGAVAELPGVHQLGEAVAFGEDKIGQVGHTIAETGVGKFVGEEMGKAGHTVGDFASSHEPNYQTPVIGGLERAADVVKQGLTTVGQVSHNIDTSVEQGYQNAVSGGQHLINDAVHGIKDHFSAGDNQQPVSDAVTATTVIDTALPTHDVTHQVDFSHVGINGYHAEAWDHAQHGATWAYDVHNTWTSEAMKFNIYADADKINYFALHMPNDQVAIINLTDGASAIHHHGDQFSFVFDKNNTTDHFTLMDEHGKSLGTITSSDAFKLFNTTGHLAPAHGASSDFSGATQHNLRSLIDFGHFQANSHGEVDFTRIGQIQGHGGFGDLDKLTITEKVQEVAPFGHHEPEEFHSFAAPALSGIDEKEDAVLSHLQGMFSGPGKELDYITDSQLLHADESLYNLWHEHPGMAAIEAATFIGAGAIVGTIPAKTRWGKIARGAVEFGLFTVNPVYAAYAALGWASLRLKAKLANRKKKKRLPEETNPAVGAGSTQQQTPLPQTGPLTPSEPTIPTPESVPSTVAGGGDDTSGVAPAPTFPAQEPVQPPATPENLPATAPIGEEEEPVAPPAPAIGSIPTETQPISSAIAAEPQGATPPPAPPTEPASDAVTATVPTNEQTAQQQVPEVLPDTEAVNAQTIIPETLHSIEEEKQKEETEQPTEPTTGEPQQ